MTKHERAIVPAADMPPTDAAAAAVPKGAIDPRFDVSQIATRGHVLQARVTRMVKIAKLPMIALVFVGAWQIYQKGVAHGIPAAPPLPFVRDLLTFDKDSYFDLGGGLRGGPDSAWMASYKPKPESLSQADLDALVGAVRDDYREHGGSAADWTKTAALAHKPQITRPTKAIAQYADRLKDGIVVLPEGGSMISVLAHTQGQWSITFFRGGECQTALGPIAAGCEDVTKMDGVKPYLTSYFNSIKPEPVKE